MLLFIKFGIFQGHPRKSIMCNRPFYDLLPTIKCDTPKTVQRRLELNAGMQIRGALYSLEKVLNFSSVQLSLRYTVWSLMV